EIGVDYVIQADGQQIFVSVGKDTKLLELLSQVGDKLTRLNGTLALVDDPREEKKHDPAFPGRPKTLVVHVTSLELNGLNGKEQVSITAVGTLHPQSVQFPIAGPARLWEIAAGKESLPFSAGEEELLKQLVKFEGNEVVATGTLKNGAFVVRTLTISL